MYIWYMSFELFEFCSLFLAQCNLDTLGFNMWTLWEPKLYREVGSKEKKEYDYVYILISKLESFSFNNCKGQFTFLDLEWWKNLIPELMIKELNEIHFVGLYVYIYLFGSSSVNISGQQRHSALRREMVITPVNIKSYDILYYYTF